MARDTANPVSRVVQTSGALQNHINLIESTDRLNGELKLTTPEKSVHVNFNL